MTARRIRIGPAVFLTLLAAHIAAGGARADFNLTFFGEADSIGAVDSNSYLVLRARRAQPGQFVNYEFTNNGKVIVNKDGSHFGFQGENTANVADDSRKTYVMYKGKAVRSFNGLDVTDTKATIGPKLTASIDGGFFDPKGGGMKDLATALVSAGFGNSSFAYPAFSSDLGQANPPPLFVGVDLQQWVSDGGAVGDDDVGSLYQVTDGAVTGLLSGTGPSASELAGYFFSSTEPVAGSTGFSGTPFTGEVTLSALLELGLGVPEPASAALLGSGAAGLAACALRRRARRS